MSVYALIDYRTERVEEYIFRNGVGMEKALDTALPGLRSDRYHRICYEDLIAFPIEQMAVLYERLSPGNIEEVLPAIRAYLNRPLGTIPSGSTFHATMRPGYRSASAI